MFYILFLLHYFKLYLYIFKKHKYYKVKQQKENTFIPYQKYISNRKKPEWVKKEIIKIKAINPNLSHRIIATIFNDKFKNDYVGKTYVGYTLKNHLYEIQEIRKKFKNKSPYKVQFNRVWGIDLTFIDKKPIIGIVEHNSRKLLALVPLYQKSSIAILKVIVDILEHYPKPKFIRTDNENCFTSKLLRFSLWFLNIKHQTTHLNSPWENGRMERLFGTFKSTISLLRYDKDDLEYLTYSFQYWYNNIRYHQNLNYKTPVFVYQKHINKLYKEKQKE